MAYNLSQKSKDQAAASDTALKMKQEPKLARDLRLLYFLPIAHLFLRSYPKTARVPNLQQHNAKLVDILNKNYSKTSRLFLNQVRTALGPPDNAEEVNEQINLSNRIEQSRNVHLSSKQIAQTTWDSLSKSVKETILGAAAAGIVLTGRQIAKRAHTKFRRESNNRVPGIALTETQAAAESAKYTEMNTLVRNNAVFPRADVNLAKDEVMKTWLAILDRATRPAHAEADGQTVPFNEPYTVMGEKLRFPRDTSLGASPANVINCRCSSIKSIRRRR